MENKVYYGEYSLKHWIDLILKGNIMLPWYQRSFVWEKEQIERLIKTFDDNQFVPTVVIGAVKENGEWRNFILDGQQRLTSILFAKYNKYIDKKGFLAKQPDKKIQPIADDVVGVADIDDNETDNNDEEIKIIKWNFNEIIKDKRINSEEIDKDYYKTLLDVSKNEKFFDEHYLGFAYIKPNNNVNEEEQSEFYSDIFRNINTGGAKLTRQESRKSLYFLKENLKDFFAPSFLDNFKVETSSKESGLIDFIKYLSILSQYKGNNSNLREYGGRDWEKNENYYHKYIMSVVGNNSNNKLHFDVSYPTNPYNNDRIELLKNYLESFGIPKSFNSIIDMDVHFFGLINEVLFFSRELDETKREDLKNELNAKITELREIKNHKYNPNALKYLKSRIIASMEIYKNYRKI
ncbi:hypothetical protein EZS27_028894 [termite gut metagenome]|uniref:GmrSD restriction endonucleases N-terminal domain-containing protein n=1 Tax=termite gut metagenome TaxID=433724 RepID=A0A5J4QKD0_9ZZZZ